MVISEWLKTGILSIELTEGVNGYVRYYGPRAWMVGLERRSGERVGAPGRERMGEGGGDGEFSGVWRGEW